tara:strand:+ start:2293 stop:2601 length:309 start_codon:yes stop_codon:yes gene_type:complete
MGKKSILLLGRLGVNVENVGKNLSVRDVELLAGTNLKEVKTAFDESTIDIVIMGAGINLDDRIAIIRYVFEASSSTTVHMKDRQSGPAGMLPFVDNILKGLI